MLPANIPPAPNTVGAKACKANGAAIANAIGAIVLNAFDFVRNHQIILLHQASSNQKLPLFE